MMFLRQETAGHVKYVLPCAKNGLKKKEKKKAPLRVVVGIVCECHPCASAVLGLFPVTKADGVQASENCTCPISISKCRVCVCVPSDAFHVRMSKMADGNVLKKSFMNKNNPVMSFFGGGG